MSNRQQGYGFPPGGGFPGSFPPGGHPGGQMGPMSRPPQFTPPIPASQFGVEGMRWCLHRNTFVWMRSGSEFWFFPTFVLRSAIVGFRWRGFGWVYHVINPSNVRTFQCF